MDQTSRQQIIILAEKLASQQMEVAVLLRESARINRLLLESLFPSKATLMPIAGRKLGAPGRRPVLEIHAWRDGRMVAIPWRTYRD